MQQRTTIRGAPVSRISAVRKAEWKLVVNRERVPDQPQLYDLSDLSADLAEQKNLANKHPDVIDELLPWMKQWRR